MSFQKIRYFCRVNFCRMGESSIFLIDIDKVLRDKAGKKAERIPRFFSVIFETYRASGGD